MIIIKTLNVNIYDNLSNEEVLDIACKKNHVNKQDVSKWYIVKKSVDARNKEDVHFVYSINVLLGKEKEEQQENQYIVNNKKELSKRPIVVGAGPAGLFAAYTLALNGYNPIYKIEVGILINSILLQPLNA